MPATGSSSRSLPGVGSDGTHEVHCWLCRQIIGRTTLSMSRALCALCARSEAGEEITEAALRDYTASRAQLGSTSMLLLDDTAPVPVVPGRKKFSLSAIGEGVNMALGFLRRKPEEASAAASIARSRRRGSLLAGLSEDDATDGLGSMSDVDKLLTKHKEGG